jgi:hypothetical protein
MKVVVERVVRDTHTPARIDEIDIAKDAGLEALYGLEIPVLLVDGRKAAKFRISESELTRMLSSRAGGVEEAGGA